MLRSMLKLAIRNIKCCKSPGIDGILAEVYKALPENFLNLLTLSQRYLMDSQENILVDGHKDSSVQFTKQGTKLSQIHSSYRGITLFNCTGNLKFTLWYLVPIEWAERNNILPEVQCAFRKDWRTADCSFILTTLVEKARVDTFPVLICYVDLKKALDNIQYDLLWSKLLLEG